VYSLFHKLIDKKAIKTPFLNEKLLDISRVFIFENVFPVIAKLIDNQKSYIPLKNIANTGKI
jgi:hypothetical protein